MLRWLIWAGLLTNAAFVGQSAEVHRAGVTVAPGNARDDAEFVAELKRHFTVTNAGMPARHTAEMVAVLNQALMAARTSLSVKIPDPGRVTALVERGEDILAAAWPESMGELGQDAVLPALLWDDSTSTEIVFRVNKTHFASPRQVQQLIESISIWNQVYRAGARLVYRLDPSLGLWFTGHSMSGRVAQFHWSEIVYSGIVLGGKAYLSVRRLQPDGAQDEWKGVKERFPPLRVRLRGMPTAKLLSEIGAQLARKPEAQTAARDRVIVAELLGRDDFTVQEFAELLSCNVGTDYSGVNRPYLIQAAIQNNRTEKFASAIRTYAQFHPEISVWYEGLRSSQ